MRKTHYIPITADVPGAANDANCALIRRTIRTALAAEGLTAPCEVDVLLKAQRPFRMWIQKGSRTRSLRRPWIMKAAPTKQR